MRTERQWADELLDEWARTLTWGTGESRESVFDRRGRAALRSYLVDTCGDDDTLDMWGEFPEHTDRLTWARTLRGVRRSVDTLIRMTRGCGSDATRAAVSAIEWAQLEREAKFGRHIAAEFYLEWTLSSIEESGDE